MSALVDFDKINLFVKELELYISNQNPSFNCSVSYEVDSDGLYLNTEEWYRGGLQHEASIFISHNTMIDCTKEYMIDLYEEEEQRCKK